MVCLAEKPREELERMATAQAEKIEQLEAKVAWFEEQFRLAKQRQFGSSSEQTAAVQEPNLFNEAEVIAEPALPEPPVEVITYNRRPRTKGKREAQLADLTVEVVEHRLPEESQVCPQCEGALHEMGTEVRQELKIVPAQVSVVKHVRFKYACRHCQQEEVTTPVVIAKAPAPAFPNSVASPSAVAHIMTEKFVMGSPLYRQEQQLERNGIDLSRQTMANWMIRGAGWLETIYDRMRRMLLAGDIIHADESTLQVLKELGRAPTTDSFMWLYRTGREGPPIVLFEYQPTRGREHPKRFLGDFKGFLNADGYGAYEGISTKIILVGCWSHARRKFDEAVKSLPPSTRKGGKTTSHAGLDFCNRIFMIERELQTATTQQRYDARLDRSQPVLREFKAWLDAQATSVIPKSTLGQAITYCNSQWAKLCNFLLDGRLEIDNNRSERSIKPFVIGRKNWLFANTPKGAKASAVIYSIVETAKENGLNPFAYLEHLFKHLPNIDVTDPTAVDNFLPWAEDVQQE
jgi:transposase